MTENQAQVTPPRSYFVDESGDGVLFGRRGRLLLGKPGSLRFFMLGLLDARDPAALQADLDQLRANLLAETYFQGVPSLTKTARAFHAKDDLPEIRREVFRILLAHDLKFSAVIKDMHSVAEYVRNRNLRDPQYMYHPDELYDLTVRRLFKARLHKEDKLPRLFRHTRQGESDPCPHSGSGDSPQQLLPQKGHSNNFGDSRACRSPSPICRTSGRRLLSVGIAAVIQQARRTVLTGNLGESIRRGRR